MSSLYKSSLNFEQPFILKINSPRLNESPVLPTLASVRKNSDFTLPSLVGQLRSQNASPTQEKGSLGAIAIPVSQDIETNHTENTSARKGLAKGQTYKRPKLLKQNRPKDKKTVSQDYLGMVKSPLKDQEDAIESQIAALKMAKGNSMGAINKPQMPATNACLLQRRHIENIKKPSKVNAKRDSITKMEKIFFSESPKKEIKLQAHDYIHNFNSYLSSRNCTLANIQFESGDNTVNFGALEEKLSSIPKIPQKETLTLPYINSPFSPEDTVIQEPRSTKKKPCLDPFSEIVKYQNHKMPSYLALGAETRHKMFEEVKRQAPEKIDINILVELRDKQIPQALTKFINQVDGDQVKKKEEDLKSREPNRNALYQFYALNKNAQKKIKSKLEKTVSDNSRFLKL